MKRQSTVVMTSAAALLVTGGLLVAGPLNPPAGPVAPTYKTLTEVEPRTAINAANTPGDTDSVFKITQPGSYYLMGNVTGAAGKHGIEIAASGVTIDLNGFDLAGVPGMGAFDGVSVTTSGLTDITVINGSVRNWGDDGVDLWSTAAANCRVEGVLASGNAGNGIMAGHGSTVTHCSSHNNTTGGGIGYGIFGGVACTITHCSAYTNVGRGIFASNGGTISHCSSYQNGDFGILTSAGSTISHCSSRNNGNDGFSVNNASTITNCTAVSNTGRGIFGASGCTVADCTAHQNTLDGISCTSLCIIRGNTCSQNGNGGDGAGILTTIGNNRIEGNNCTGADRGIDVDATRNIIIGNTCGGNTVNWSIVANNVVGPILDRTSPGSAAINGNAAPSSLSTTDPNANFSY